MRADAIASVFIIALTGACSVYGLIAVFGNFIG
jgi:hypothetical protein